MLANDENKIDYAFKLSMSIDIAAVSNNDSRGSTPLYELNRYVRPQRVWFFSRFGHKWGMGMGIYFKKKPLFHHYRKEN